MHEGEWLLHEMGVAMHEGVCPLHERGVAMHEGLWLIAV